MLFGRYIMYSREDLLVLTTDYFTVIEFHVDHLIVKSNNSGHTWAMYQTKDNCIMLMHKHRDSDKFHIQGGYKYLSDSIMDCVTHDLYTIRGRRGPGRHAPGRTFVDDILDIYQSA